MFPKSAFFLSKLSRIAVLTLLASAVAALQSETYIVPNVRGGMVMNLGARAQDIRLPASNLQEIQKEIGRLKDYKAPEVDQLPGELFKYRGEALVRALHWIITKVWEDEVLPQEWMEGIRQ